MHMTTIALLALMNAQSAQNDAESAAATTMQPPADASVMESGSWILRVAGEPENELESREGPEGPLYRAGVVMTDTKLPVGYPAPTAPGAYEVKHYASVRRAEFTSGNGRGINGQNGFWPLFQHISRNDIAMTAPVEMEVSDDNNDGDPDQWTMSFLYHQLSDGPTGEDGNVVIVDTEPMTYLALGVQGRRGENTWETLAAELDTWIAASPDWQRVGMPRVLGYNGPNVPGRNQWWEIQMPIEPAETPVSPEPTAEITAPADDAPVFREVDAEG